jgi:Xaa-Pro aminopeptidase
MQGRTPQAGDVYSLLVENNGAGGYYTELSRIFVLGKAPQELLHAHAAVLEAQGASACVHATPKQVFEIH